MNEPKLRCGIYFMMKRKTIIYVGQSKRLPLRFNFTHAEIDFDRLRIIECNEADLIKYEKRWIKKFNPKYNTFYTLDWSHPMLGNTNPNAGRPKYSIFDRLEVGEIMVWTKRYGATTAIRWFNNTRKPKELVSFPKEGKVYITRAK